jgi:outer membrane receptor protein involved in Fe transport
VRTSSGALHGATVASGGYIIQTNVNAGAALNSGIDSSANYRYALPTGWGTLATTLNGTWLQHDIITPFPGATRYDCAGLYGATCTVGVHPSWRHVMRVTWETLRKLMLSAQWRYIGGTSLDSNSSNPSLQYGEFGAYSSLYAHIPGYSYLDLTAVAHPLSNIELRLGVNNVLDKDPPLLPTQLANEAQNNTYNSYDTLGRQLYVAFTVTL